MRNCSEVLLAPPLCLKHWFIRSSGDGVDDVHPTARRCIDCSLWNLPPAQVSEVEVELCRKTMVLSFWTMSDCTAEVVALVLIVAEVVHTVTGCN